MRKAICPGVIADANSFKASRRIALRSERVALLFQRQSGYTGLSSQCPEGIYGGQFVHPFARTAL